MNILYKFKLTGNCSKTIDNKKPSELSNAKKTIV